MEIVPSETGEINSASKSSTLIRLCPLLASLTSTANRTDQGYASCLLCIKADGPLLSAGTICHFRPFRKFGSLPGDSSVKVRPFRASVCLGYQGQRVNTGLFSKDTLRSNSSSSLVDHLLCD
jgi:hypothetical protein